MENYIRLTKRLALTGKYSRHEADRLVAQGRVMVDGVVAVPGTKVPINGGLISVDGVVIKNGDDKVYKFHKPKGVLSSYYDPNGKRNLTYFRELSDIRLGYSGRLDYDSEGLMLFTSRGDLIYKLQRSEFKVEKEYLVDIDMDISDEWRKRLEYGVVSQDDKFLPCTVVKLSKCRYKVILTEGKKRQVRRMFAIAGANVTRLVRVRIGNILLDKMKPGEFLSISDKEITELEKCIELK